MEEDSVLRKILLYCLTVLGVLIILLFILLATAILVSALWLIFLSIWDSISQI